MGRINGLVKSDLSAPFLNTDMTQGTKLLTKFAAEVLAKEPGTLVFDVELDRKRAQFVLYEV